MDSKRIKEIQLETAYPNSVSVQQALLKVWNESAKQEREAVRAEIGIILNIFNEKNVKGVRYKDLLKSVIGNLQILSESLKGDE